MVALMVILTLIIALLGILVVGLLRSHADILRSLHSLGVGVGDPAEKTSRNGVAQGVAPLKIGPPLPAERTSSSVHSVGGVTPSGEAMAFAVTGVDQFTLFAFLSSGCSTCQGFWEAFRSPEHLGLPDDVRLVVVTKGMEFEISAEIAGKGARVPVVMCTKAWSDYEVPGSPFFVLVDGRRGRRIGEGVANHFSQVVDLVRRAMVDATGNPESAASTSPKSSARKSQRLDGPARELANDAELIRAGIFPGDASLYPRSLEEIFRSTSVGKGAPVDLAQPDH